MHHQNEYKKKAAKKLIGYLQRHKEHIPNYHAREKQGATVSSGLTEKANDLVVVRRLKDPIMLANRPPSAASAIKTR